MLTLIALPLYVLTTTGSATLTGVTGASATLPVVLGGTFGGVLVDRTGYRRTTVLASLVSAVSIGMIPLLHATVGLPLPLLLGLVGLSGLLDSPAQSARSAMLPEAAGTAGVPLERAVAWLEATERGARMLGAPLAGLGVTAFGAVNMLTLDAVSFVLCALLVSRWLPAPRGGATEKSLPAAGYWRDLSDGLRFTARDRLLRVVVLLVLLTNLLDAAKSTVLLPVFARDELGGAPAFGLLVGVMAAGALGGNLVFSAIGHRLPRRAVFVAAFTVTGLPWLAMGAGLPLGLLVAVVAFSGFGAGAINPIIGMVELERIPPGLRARVLGLINAGCWAATPVGSVAAGIAVGNLGLQSSLLVGGAAYVLLTLSPLLGGPWRELRRPHKLPLEPGAACVEP